MNGDPFHEDFDGPPVIPELVHAQIERPAFDYRSLPRPLGGVLAFAFSPRGAPIVLSVAGAFFWMWAFGLFLWFCTLRLHQSAAHTDAPPVVSNDPVADAPVPALPEPAVERVAEQRTEAPAIGVPGTAAAARAVDSPFNNLAAIRALDGRWREVAKCRRGKVWGKASTTVTFASDGSVTHVDVGSPFAGTPTGDCIADTLSRTHAPPFGGDDAELVYRVYVAPK